MDQDAPQLATRAGDEPGTSPTATAPVLNVSDLVVDFPSNSSPVRAVRGVSFSLAAGESLAILGESGSGKSVTGKALLGLVDAPARVRGSIEFMGKNLVGLPEDELKPLRGEGIAMVFQDSLDSLNPVYTVGSQLSEIFRVRLGWSRKAAREEAVKLMKQVGIPSAARRMNDYPHQFSGGMRQRICIAMAIALRPRLLIADEPTTALDVTVQAGILRLIRRLQLETESALIFVTHDLSVARLIATRVAVMYAGRIVESGPIEQIFQRPAHPYTRALMSSHPSASSSWTDLRPISGSPPDKSSVISGCAFHPRCPIAHDICAGERPALADIGDGRASRCHFAQEVLDGQL